MKACVLTVLGWAFVLGVVAGETQAQSTSFNYRGQLQQGGQPANGNFDLRFRAYSVLTGGSPAATAACADNVAVSNGQFSTNIDFGGAVLATWGQLYLEIDVRSDAGQTCGSGAGYVTLAPRQLLTPAPRAVHANTAWALAAPDGAPNPAVFVDNTGRIGIGTTTPQAGLHLVTPSTGEGARLQGLLSSESNQAWLGFNNSAGLRIGYVGDGSTGDNNIFLSSIGDVTLETTSGRVLNATNQGRVGIMTTTPQATLDVNGSIRVSPTDRWKSIHGAAFIPNQFNGDPAVDGRLNVIDNFNSPLNSGVIGYAGTFGPVDYTAPIELPDGAVIQELCVTGRDTNTTQNITITLYRTNISSGLIEQVINTFTPGSGDNITGCNTAALSPALANINNNAFVYALRARMSTNDNGTHTLNAVRVRYSVTSPLP